MSKHWTLDDVQWDRFDGTKVDPRLLGMVKASALVERNGADYGLYLRNVFGEDPEFCAIVDEWAAEEIQHGEALRRWAELADPGFDFDRAFRCFTEGYSLPLETRTSVRGSRCGELVARCIVETGTSSLYAALYDACEEPVLREICQRIGADEIRHYKLFLTWVERYHQREGLGRWSRAKVALGRMWESGDDELAWAWYAANERDRPYDHRRDSDAITRVAYACYRPVHVRKVVRMVLRAIGFRSGPRVDALLTRLVWGLVRWRLRRLDRVAA